MSNAYSHSVKFCRSDVSNNILDAIMSAGASLCAYTKLTDIKIYIIQVLNIGDLLTNNASLQQKLAAYQYNIEQESEEIKSILRTRMALIIVIILLELIIFFGIWYLSEFYIYNKFSVRKKERACENYIFNPTDLKVKDS